MRALPSPAVTVDGPRRAEAPALDSGSAAMAEPSYGGAVAEATTDASTAEGPAGLASPRWWQGTLFAALLLVAFYGIAIAAMLVGGAVIHAVSPKRHVDVFAALHHLLVVGILLGLSVLWLLPPHPWARRLLASEPRERPARRARRARRGGPVVTTIADHACRGPSTPGPYPRGPEQGAAG